MEQSSKESVRVSSILLKKSEGEMNGEVLRVKNARERQELYQDYISSKRCIVLTLEKTHQPLKHRILRTPYRGVHVESSHHSRGDE
jgi:hypothetical protein